NRTVLAASCAAVTGVFCGFPFDTVKTRMQTHSYRSLNDCLRKTYRAEGVRGFFRGIVPPLLTVSAIRATSFSVYERTKQRMREMGWQTDRTLSLGAGSFLAGGASGLAVAALSCPFELVKIQRQLQVLLARQRLVDPRTLPTWASVREIVQLRGPFGLFYGLRSHLMRDLAGTGTYFAGYECLKYNLAALENGRPSASVHFLAGGFAGVFCWILTFPLDLVKSIIQKDVTSVAIVRTGTHVGVDASSSAAAAATTAAGMGRSSSLISGQVAAGAAAGGSVMNGTTVPSPARAPSGWRVARDIWQRAGIRGLYNGISVTLIRAFPIHALNFTVYEYVTGRIQEFAQAD
ncbi:mitochondrial carrier domain-containing protein, partial [Thamnocephalis sphaerospora]